MQRVIDSEHDLKSAEKQTLAFVEQYVSRGCSPMCGNSICQDRRFMVRGMPALEAWFHYSNIDVSTIKELAVRWRPDIMARLEKKGAHRALDDIIESIEELRTYKASFFNLGDS